jgi:hypothetical protein
MPQTASKSFQRLHHEGSIPQGMTMDWDYERLCEINLVGDEYVNLLSICELMKIITEGRSSEY